MSGNHGHSEAISRHRGSVDPRNAAAHGEIVDQVARLEVIGAVQNDVGIAEQFRDIRGREIGHDAAHRIDELMRAIRRAAATAFGRASAASSSSKSHCRCRLLAST